MYKEGIQKVGITKVVATVNDNEAALTKAQDQFSFDPDLREYKTLIHIRCFSHVLNLLSEKVFERTSTTSRLLELVKSAVKSIRNSNVFQGYFKRIANEKNFKVSLTLPGIHRNLFSPQECMFFLRLFQS